jgi:autotransporter-associated beta strand protein
MGKLKNQWIVMAAVSAIPVVVSSGVAAPTTVSSVYIMDPNPNGLPLADAPTNTGTNGIALAAFQTLMTGSTTNTVTSASPSSAFANNAGGVLDFQEQFQGGSFPNQAGPNNGVTLGSGSTSVITADYGITESSSVGFYRNPVATGDGIDANTNQGGNIISGGYESDSPPSAPTGGATGYVDFITTPPTVTTSSDPNASANVGGGYMGIVGTATPCTLMFNQGLADFGITALIRGSTRDTELVASVTQNGNPVTTISTSDVTVTTTCTFFGIALTASQLAAGDVISQVVIESPTTGSVNRYDDMALIVPALTWDNAGSTGDGATWDVNANQNWSYISAPAATVNPNNTPVIFNDNNNAASNGGTNANAYNVKLNTLVTPASVTVNNSLGNYTISGTGGIGGTGSLSKLGTGTLKMSTANTYTGGTIVDGGVLEIAPTSSPATSTALGTGPLTINGATVKLDSNVTAGSQSASPAAPTSSLNITSLSILGNGTLDIGNNHLIINYGSGTDPISSIVALIDSGYSGGANGAWTGPGITSSAAVANSAHYGIGYADAADAGNPTGLSSGQIEIMYTLLGDANLDGKVNGSDFTLMATNFNDSVTNGWDKGDFNYSGTVNGDDFVLLASNFNDFASQSSIASADLQALDFFATANQITLTSVPEPASLGLLTLSCTSFLIRKRRVPLHTI